MLKKRFIVFNKGFSTEDTLSLFSTSVILSLFQNDTQLLFWIKLFLLDVLTRSFLPLKAKFILLQDPLFLDTFFSFVLTLQSLLFNAHYRQCLDSQSHYILDRFKKCRKEVLEYFVFNNMYVSLNERWIWKNWHNITRPCFSYSTL